MYKSFKIENFRGFKDFNIKDLERINIISGKNDTGKSALLEALWIHGGKNNPQNVLAVNAFRGMDLYKLDFSPTAEKPWDSLFYNGKTDSTIEFTGKWNSQERATLIRSKVPKSIVYKGTRKSEDQSTPEISEVEDEVLEFIEITNGKSHPHNLRLTPQGFASEFPKPDYPVFYVYSRKSTPVVEDAELYGKLDLTNQIGDIIEILKIIEPRLKRLSVIYVNNIPLIHGDIGLEKMLPLPFMGEGISRLLSLILRISIAKDGVVLIDEIENGIHYSVMEKIWHVINEASKKYNVQIFVTTHSYECLKYAYQALSKDNDTDFKFIRLDRENGHVNAKYYDKNNLEFAFKADVEIR